MRNDSSARLLASLQSEFAGRLGVHWGPSRGYVIFFFALNSIFAIQAQHYCEVCARIVLTLSIIVTQNLWRERMILGRSGISLRMSGPRRIRDIRRSRRQSTKPYV